MSRFYRLATIVERHLHEQSEKLLKACKEGSLPTVRSIMPKLYPPSSSRIISGVPSPRFLLITTVKHKQPSVLKYLLDNLPVTPEDQSPWDSEPGSDTGREAPFISKCKDDFFTDELVYEAIESGSSPVFQALLDAGMDVNRESDWWPSPPLTQAICNKDVKMVKLMLQNGAYVDAKDTETGYSSLADAVNESSREVTLALLEHGTEIPGSGALLMAAKEGKIDIAKLLLERGADINEVVYQDPSEEDEEEAYVGKYARELSGKEIEEVKAQEEKTKNKKWHSGPALLWAAEYGQAEMVKFLLDMGARDDICDSDSKTALDMARKGNYTGVVKILEEPVEEKKEQYTRPLRSCSSTLTRPWYRDTKETVEGHSSK